MRRPGSKHTELKAGDFEGASSELLCHLFSQALSAAPRFALEILKSLSAGACWDRYSAGLDAKLPLAEALSRSEPLSRAVMAKLASAGGEIEHRAFESSWQEALYEGHLPEEAASRLRGRWVRKAQRKGWAGAQWLARDARMALLAGRPQCAADALGALLDLGEEGMQAADARRGDWPRGGPALEGMKQAQQKQWRDRLKEDARYSSELAHAKNDCSLAALALKLAEGLNGSGDAAAVAQARRLEALVGRMREAGCALSPNLYARAYASGVCAENTKTVKKMGQGPAAAGFLWPALEAVLSWDSPDPGALWKRFCSDHGDAWGLSGDDPFLPMAHLAQPAAACQLGCAKAGEMALWGLKNGYVPKKGAIWISPRLLESLETNAAALLPRVSQGMLAGSAFAQCAKGKLAQAAAGRSYESEGPQAWTEASFADLACFSGNAQLAGALASSGAAAPAAAPGSSRPAAKKALAAFEALALGKASAGKKGVAPVSAPAKRL